MTNNLLRSHREVIFITFLNIFWGQENIGQNFLTERNLAFWGNKVETLNYLENKGHRPPGMHRSKINSMDPTKAITISSLHG